MKLLTTNRGTPQTLTVSQAAEILGIARQGVLKLIDRGVLTPVAKDAIGGRRGFRYLLSKEEVEGLKRERG